MKSIYLKQGFSKYRNEMVGPKGDFYKQIIIDPIILNFLGDIKGKTILDLGCGNGYLANKLIKKGAKKVVGIDISKYNINYAKKNYKKNNKVDFFVHDALKDFPFNKNSFDVVYSNMLLPHIKEIGKVFEEVYKILKNGGIFVFSTIHPSRLLYNFAIQNKNKIQGVGNYFRKGRTNFEMGGDSEENITGKEICKKYKVENYQRPIEEYITNLASKGFSLKLFKEPKLSKKILQLQPKFEEYKNHPISLIIGCIKN